MNRLVWEYEPDMYELEDETYNWDDIEFESTVRYGIYEDITYNELMKDFDEESEV